MSGDYTRFTFKPENDYSAVLKQQGRVSLDADWNELVEIADRRWRAETLDVVGRCAVPETTPDGFRIQDADPEKGSFTIGRGRIYVDGLLVECRGGGPRTYDPVLAEVVSTEPLPYASQPYVPPPLPPVLSPKPGQTDIVYLDVWQREVTALEAPEIKEIALDGADTATRIQTVWQVRVLEDVSSMHCGAPSDKWDQAVAPSAGRLTTSAVAPPSSDDPCIVSATGGYRGLYNQLYRVQIHEGGNLGAAKFKWSRDNASVGAAVEAIEPDTHRVTVRSLGRDDLLGFEEGGWIELLDDYVDLGGQPALMARIVRIDEGRRVLTLDREIPPRFVPADPDAEKFASRHTRVRRWDQREGIDEDGLLDVVAGPVEVERGIRVEFSLDADYSDGKLRAGDYWVFSARTADGSVELLEKAPPRGVQHHYCRLALVHWGSTPESTIVADCREHWPPARCCTIAVRPGQDIQAAIDRLPAEGGCVCLLPGLHQVRRPILITGRQSVTLEGNRESSRVVYLPDPSTEVAAGLSVAGESRHIVLRDFSLESAAPHLVFVDGRSIDVTVSGMVLRAASPTRGIPQRRGCESSTPSFDWKDLDPAARRPVGSCVLLGDCRFVKIVDSRMEGPNGVVQADAESLDQQRQASPAAQEPDPGQEEEAAPTEDDSDASGEEIEAAPAVVQTLQAVTISNNLIQARISGVRLEDALDIQVDHNRIEAGTLLRAVRPRAGHITPDEDSRDVAAVFAVLVEKCDVLENTLEGRRGVVLGCARGVRVEHNEIENAESAITLGFIFDSHVDRNTIRAAPWIGAVTAPGRISGIARTQPGTADLHAFLPSDSSMDSSDRWPGGQGGREPEEQIAIRMLVARSLTISGNEIDAPVGIGIYRGRAISCPPEYVSSLVRLLRIERLWRFAVELGWLLYAIYQTFAGASPSPAGGDEGEESVGRVLTRAEFENRMAAALASCIASWPVPFLSKVVVSTNRLRVHDSGICLEQILSIGGLQITGNRVSGHRRTGIRVHPFYGMGFADVFAKGVRCGFEWVPLVLALLRARLAAFLANEDVEPVSEGGTDRNATLVALQATSVFVSLCARYCQAKTEEASTEEEKPSPAQDLFDALEDLLSHMDPCLVPDLVNQSYRVDHNVVAGAGNGIYAGIDGTHVTENRVTVLPQSPVPYETIVLGSLLDQHFTGEIWPCRSEIAALASALMDLDTDALIFQAEATKGWIVDNWTLQFSATSFEGEFRELIGQIRTEVTHLSPVSSRLAAIETALQQDSVDPSEVDECWEALLALIEGALVGYGIVLLGADMVCARNRVDAQSGCGAPPTLGGLIGFQPDPTAIVQPSAMVVHEGDHQGMIEIPFWELSYPVPDRPAIGGIWQRSNVAEIMRSWLARSRPEIDPQVLWSVVAEVLSERFARNRDLTVADNHVNQALAHGIKVGGAVGMNHVDVSGNVVTDAARYAVLHRGDCVVKLHRNRFVRTPEVFLFQRLNWHPGFLRLVYVWNWGGTTAFSHNYGDSGEHSGTAEGGLTPSFGYLSVVEIHSGVVVAIGNDVRTNFPVAFRVHAPQNGLFTDNVTNKPNSIYGPDLAENGIVKDPNVEL